MGEPEQEFSTAGYSALVKRYRELGYAFKAFTDDDIRFDARQIFLRHDVDMCLELALTLAEQEAKLGVSATYCILLSSDLYNPFSRTNIERIRAIRSAGHAIALHFDVTVYFKPGEAMDIARLNQAVAQEAAQLAFICEAPVRVMSFHRPSQELQGMDGDIGGLIHTYQPRFFRDIAYISDSEGRWRFGHPLEHSSLSEGRAVQLLTHPVWWMRDGEQTTGLPLAALDRLVETHMQCYRHELARNCKTYRVRLSDQDWGDQR